MVWIHRRPILTHTDVLSYEYKLYNEDGLEMHCNRQGLRILLAFGWNYGKQPVSLAIDHILQQQKCLRLRGHSEPFVEPIQPQRGLSQQLYSNTHTELAK